MDKFALKSNNFIKKYSLFVVLVVAAVLMIVIYLFWLETKSVPLLQVQPEEQHLYGGGFKDIKKPSNQFKAGKIEK